MCLVAVQCTGVIVVIHDRSVCIVGRGGVRSESRAAKVALMKLKMKAVGDKSLPQVQYIFCGKLYFLSGNIHIKCGCNLEFEDKP